MLKHFFFIASLWLLSLTVFAQTVQRDPAIRYGKLPNGLTYYVRHNAEPKGQAEFYIAQNVGSMQEEDNQRGLAHFLEHMCFNGTTNFPDKNLINYLGSIGVQFGRNLNAYTSFDATVYNISAVPVSREGIVDSCLLVLHDWSHDLLLQDKEIDAERGVIHEEWRTGDASERMFTTLLPQVYPDSRYGQRMPIGTMEVVDNFPYQTLRDYYRTWYRPDLQAVLVVGDVDADLVVEKIRTTFADVQLPAERAERVFLPVADNKAPLVGMVSDKEQTVNQLMIMWKQQPMPVELKSTPDYYVYNTIKQAISQMFNLRIAEIMQKPNPPFLNTRFGVYDFLVSKTREAATLSIIYSDGGLEPALNTAMTELMRAVRFGFTFGEFERFRTEYLRAYEQSYIEREKRTSNEYVEEYVSNFIDNEPIPGIEFEYSLIQQIMQSDQLLDMINQTMRELVTDDNMVVCQMMTAGEAEKGLEKQQLLSMIEKVKGSEVEAYVDETIDRPLLAEVPSQGRLVKEEDGAYGSRVLTLSNGVRVVMRATDFQADEIQMMGFRPGGFHSFEDADVEQSCWVGALHARMGMGDFSAIDLRKVLSGKNVSVDVDLSNDYDRVSGSASVRDVETMLQLLTMNFMPQRIDEEALAAFCQRQRQMLENQDADPRKVFNDSLRTMLTTNKDRLVLMHPEMVDRIDVSRVKALYDSRYDHADGFTFLFVGNVDDEKVKDLIVQYIGSLPVKGVEDSFVNRHDAFRRGVHENVFRRPLEMDRSTVCIGWQGAVECNMQNDILMDALTQAMQQILLDKMREEAGATYSPMVGGNVEFNAFGDEASLFVYFETSPAMRDRLVGIAHSELARVASEGVSAEQIEKTQQLLLKNYTEGQRKNSSMMAYLNCLYCYGREFNVGYADAVKALTSDKVRDFARMLLDRNNVIMVSMSPEK